MPKENFAGEAKLNFDNALVALLEAAATLRHAKDALKAVRLKGLTKAELRPLMTAARKKAEAWVKTLRPIARTCDCPACGTESQHEMRSDTCHGKEFRVASERSRKGIGVRGPVLRRCETCGKHWYELPCDDLVSYEERDRIVG